MNTEFLYVTNVPKSIKPVSLLYDIGNKFARLLYLDSSLTGQRDCFIYNPTATAAQFDQSAEDLKGKVLDSGEMLNVFFIWFPPANIMYTTMIPEGSYLLPYLFVDNLPKDFDPAEAFSSLPLLPHDIKVWNIAEKEDKWVIIRVPPNDEQDRHLLLSVIRNMKFQGFSPRVLEVVVTRNHQLSTAMIPKVVKQCLVPSSYYGNMAFIHDIPTGVTLKDLLQLAKNCEILGARVFLLELLDGRRAGLLYVPKSLPMFRFQCFLDAVRQTEYPDGAGSEAKSALVDDVWIQPIEAAPPFLTEEELQGETEDVPELICVPYLQLTNIPPGVTAAQLVFRSPQVFKAYVFQVNETATQIGYALLRGLSQEEMLRVQSHLQGLSFNGCELGIDNIWLKVRGLSAELRAKVAYQSRPHDFSSFNQIGFIGKRARNDIANSGTMVTSNDPRPVKFCSSPTPDLELTRTDFVLLDGLPKSLNERTVLMELGISVNGCTVFDSPFDEKSKSAIVHVPDMTDNWNDLFENLHSKNFQGHAVKTYELYLQCDESLELLEARHPPEYKLCPMIFVYNLSEETEPILRGYPAIQRAESMRCEEGSRCVFAILSDDEFDNIAALETLNCIRNCHDENGTPVFADLLWMAPVLTVDEYNRTVGAKPVLTTDVNLARSMWTKKGKAAAQQQNGVTNKGVPVKRHRREDDYNPYFSM